VASNLTKTPHVDELQKDQIAKDYSYRTDRVYNGFGFVPRRID